MKRIKISDIQEMCKRISDRTGKSVAITVDTMHYTGYYPHTDTKYGLYIENLLNVEYKKWDDLTAHVQKILNT